MAIPALLKRPVARVNVMFIVLTIGVSLWAHTAGPGVYHGFLGGRFFLDEAPFPLCIVTIEAETAPRWAWSRPRTFAYPLVRIRIEVDGEENARSMEVLFPGPRVIADGHEETLTPDKFASLVVGDERGLEGLAKELFVFVEAIGRGTVPLYHQHSVEEPYHYQGYLVHCASGTPAVFLIGAVVATWAVTAVGIWLAKRRRKPAITN